MSSLVVRTEVLSFLSAANTAGDITEDIVELDGEFGVLQDVLTAAEIQQGAPWLGVQFVGNDEQPISLAATNDKGSYRETGSIVLHIVTESGIGVGNSIIARGETLRDLFRGLRLGGIIIDGVTPVNLGPGTTIQFEGGYVSGSMTVSYYYDFSL